MSTIIKRLKDKLGNFVLPITNTKAVYDDNGNRLDRILKCAPIQEYNKSGIYLSIAVKNVIDENIDSVLTNSSEFNFMLKCKHKDNPWDTTYNVICNVYYKTYCCGLIIKVDGSNERYSFNYTLGQELSNIISFVDNDTISDAYNPSKTYMQGEFCIYNNTLWKSKVDNNAGNTPPNETYWRATNIVNSLNTTIKFPDFNDTIKTVQTTVWTMTPTTIEEDCFVIGQVVSGSDITAGVWVNGTTWSYSIAYATLGNGCAVYGFIPKGSTIYYRGEVRIRFIRVR